MSRIMSSEFSDYISPVKEVWDASSTYLCDTYLVPLPFDLFHCTNCFCVITETHI